MATLYKEVDLTNISLLHTDVVLQTKGTPLPNGDEPPENDPGGGDFWGEIETEHITDWFWVWTSGTDDEVLNITYSRQTSYTTVQQVYVYNNNYSSTNINSIYRDERTGEPLGPANKPQADDALEEKCEEGYTMKHTEIASKDPHSLILIVQVLNMRVV